MWKRIRILVPNIFLMFSLFSCVNCFADDQDILIVDKIKPQAFFGWYRTSQMTSPGWDVFQRTVNWVTNNSLPEETNVILFTYDGNLTDDGLASFMHLYNAGYKVREIHSQYDIVTLPSTYYDNFDLAVYAWCYPWDAKNLLDSGIPFVTSSTGHTAQMGIGTGDETMHEYIKDFYVKNNSHYITQPYALGDLTFASSMWTDATTVSGNGIALVSAVVPEPSSLVMFFMGLLGVWGLKKGNNSNYRVKS